MSSRLALALAPALWLLGPEPTGSVAVDASSLEATGDEVAAAVREKLDTLVADAGLDPATLRVQIYWFDANSFNYGIKATFDPDLPYDQLPIIKTCPECNQAALVAKVVEGVKPLIEERLKEEETAEGEEGDDTSDDTATGGEEDGEDSAEDTAPPPDTRQDRQKLGPMGTAGAVLIGIGGAGAISGGVFLGLGERRPKVDMSQFRDFRPSGYIALGTGLAMVVVGAVLLGVDRSRARKRR